MLSFDLLTKLVLFKQATFYARSVGEIYSFLLNLRITDYRCFSWIIKYLVWNSSLSSDKSVNHIVLYLLTTQKPGGFLYIWAIVTHSSGRQNLFKVSGNLRWCEICINVNVKEETQAKANPGVIHSFLNFGLVSNKGAGL